ncbi:hypothetical protein [Streptomyces paludis]|uniref:hypothetical protein n=1 Tax=Streptomyces paludis TaxID=2282738 RepID=UPI001E36B9F7|nr:hypothetical protein [Streptomyces paludis]
MNDDDSHAEDLPRLRLGLYIESLRARMPAPQYRLLMDVIRMWAENGGGTVRLRMDEEERELFTRDVQREMLHIMGLIGALRPGHEDRADHVVADLGDGEHARGALTLVPPEVAADPERLRTMRDELDAKADRRKRDEAAVEGIARASGMLPEPEPGADTDSGGDGGGERA